MEIRQTAVYRRWFDGLKDGTAQGRILIRLRRLSLGNFGGGVSELRVDHGPGYRVYFKRSGDKLVLLLAGGDKKSQARDIARAKKLAAEED